MDDELMWAVERVVALTPGSAIAIPETANEFAIKGNHLTLVKGNQFDGIIKTDPHKHVYEFLEICDIFKYRDTKNEAVRLMMFPQSLTGEAKTWLDELNEGTTENRDELRTTFISQFFPPALFDRLLGEIRAFSQNENETLTNAWLRMKEMLRNCHEEDSKVLFILRRPFLHSADAVIQVKQKQLNLGFRTKRMIFHIDSIMNHSYSNDDTCFSIDIINEILEEDFNALLDEGSEILHSIKGIILEEKLFAKFDEFMAMTPDENSEYEFDTEELPFKKSPLIPIIKSRHLLKNLLWILNSNLFIKK
nr:reverse transcriptase domain-containing protein [Tanacetum cinerariifolium]